MRKFFALMIAASMATGLMAETGLATFEDEGLWDLFETYSYNDDAAGSLTIVENPAKSGINTTDYCLKDNRLKDWSSSIGKLYNSNTSSATIDSDNRYLHVMVYAEEDVAGMFFVRSGSTDDAWAYEGKVGGIESRFNFTAGKWTDVVVDLNSISEIFGLYFLSQDWSFVKERNFYYDEIILNNDPDPRGIEVISTAATVANFEEDGTGATTIDTGSACQTIEVTDNPDPTGINTTAKTLHIHTNSTAAEWWAGVDITFWKYLSVGDENRYMHIMTKSNANDMEYVVYADGEKWAGSFTITETGWFDHVIDLYNVKNEHNLQGKTVTGIRAALGMQDTRNQNKDIYIDEIVVDNNPNPRTQTTGLQQTQITGAVHAVDGGIALRGINGTVKVFDVTGRTIVNTCVENDMNITLKKGIYVVATTDTRTKVIVK